MKKQIPELAHHSVFMSPGGRESWDLIFEGTEKLPESPSFYLCCPAKTDPSAAPAGCESLMVLVPCGCMKADADDVDYSDLVDRAR